MNHPNLLIYYGSDITTRTLSCNSANLCVSFYEYDHLHQSLQDVISYRVKIQEFIQEDTILKILHQVCSVGKYLQAHNMTPVSLMPDFIFIND